ncbi:hypothetical protein [Rhodoblastus sp.]|uniref:hypothetical protein n=1 Tax=Rhodoblastus sp. TaxID=1962975 RepID=UPI003F99F7BC
MIVDRGFDPSGTADDALRFFKNAKQQEKEMDDKPDLDRIKDRAQDVREDVNALAAEAIDAMRKSVDELKAIVAANASNSRDLGYAKLQDLKVAIRRDPLSALLLSFGFGLILGLWRQRDVRQGPA